jgi:hypothetical protein
MKIIDSSSPRIQNKPGVDKHKNSRLAHVAVSFNVRLTKPEILFQHVFI